MALTKKTAIDGLKKEDTGGAGADALTTGIAFLCDGIKDEPVWGAGTNWQIHYAYGLDLGSPTSVSKIIVYDNRDTDNFYAGRDDTDVWVSDDNVTYSFLKTFSDPTRTGSGSGYAVWELELDEPVSYRYFKVFCSSAADGLWVDGGYWCQISELEAWGESEEEGGETEGWSGKILGISPTKILGISKANIVKICGV